MGNSVLPRQTEDFSNAAHVKAFKEFQVAGVHRYSFYAIQEHTQANCFIDSNFCRQPEIVAVNNLFPYSSKGCRCFSNPVVHLGVRGAVCREYGPEVDKLVCNLEVRTIDHDVRYLRWGLMPLV